MDPLGASTQDLLRLATRASDLGAVVWNAITDRLEVDESAERLFGIRRGTFGGSLRDLMRRIREESRDAVSAALENVLGGAHLLDVEMIVDLPDGTARHLQMRGTALPDASGQPEHVLASLRDVSREAALRDELVAAQREVATRDADLQHLAEQMASTAHVNANLMARTSHEIRTRLDGVLGMGRLLLDSQLTDEQRELVTTVLAQGDGMLAIVADIVDMSAPAAELDITSIAAAELLAGHAVTIAPSVPATIRADVARLRRIVHNLVGATRGAPAIELAAMPLGGDLHELTVAVHGIDAPRDRIPQLFDGASGLGLAISAKLVGLLGGRIHAAASPGDTLVVRFALPVEEAIHEDVEPSFDPALGSRHPLRILVAEDNLLNRKVAGAFLTKLGYAPKFANDGREALAAMERERFDVVLMDVDMPVMSGIDAVRAWRRRVSRADSPRLVAVTAHALPRDRAACLEAGYDDYVAKPLRIEQLAAQLAKSPRLPDALDPASVDVAVLGVLEETLGSAVVAELVETYDADARELLQALETAAQRGDPTGLARAAHNLKSISAALGAVSLRSICAELESNSRQGIVAGAATMVAQAARELVQVRVALGEHVARVRG